MQYAKLQISSSSAEDDIVGKGSVSTATVSDASAEQKADDEASSASHDEPDVGVEKSPASPGGSSTPIGLATPPEHPATEGETVSESYAVLNADGLT